MTRLVSSVNCDSGAVIALDGGWGTGKTFIVKMLQEELEKKDIACVYVDAYAADYIADPLTAVASQIICDQGLSQEKN